MQAEEAFESALEAKRLQKEIEIRDQLEHEHMAALEVKRLKRLAAVEKEKGGAGNVPGGSGESIGQGTSARRGSSEVMSRVEA